MTLAPVAVLLVLAQVQQQPFLMPRRSNFADAGTSQWPNHIIIRYDGGTTPDAVTCLAASHGPAFECLAWESQIPTVPAPPTAPQLLLAPSASDPSGPHVVGDTYYNTTIGCHRAWNGSAFAPVTCPITSAPSQPTPPNTLGSPSATDPATSTTGYTYFNTSGRCLKVWTGSAWSPASCPNPAVTAVPPSSTAPTGASTGDLFTDSTQGCIRRYSGSAWGPCLTTEACGTASLSAITIPVLGATSATTVTISGAVAGRPCTVAGPGNVLLSIGVDAQCQITATNTASFRFTGALGLSIAAGTYTVCTHVPW